MTAELISCDDHLDLCYIPATVWEERLPRNRAAEGPRVEVDDDGAFWIWEGQRRGAYGRKPGLIDTFERAGLKGEPEPGVFRPSSIEHRLADMDLDGVAAQVIYPPSWSMKFADPTLEVACIEAFNDWFVDELCGASSGRMVPLPLLPLHSPDAAAAEVRRLAARGARGVLFDPWGGPTPPFDDSWESVWDVAEEAGLVMHFHIGSGLHSLDMQFGTWKMAPGASVVHMQMDEVLVGMIFAGVPERHPDLHFVLGECSIGWVPYVLEQMDFQQAEWHALVEERRLPLRASDYFRRQFSVTFEKDQVGVRLLDLIGADNVMWASDYPHGISTFPRSREIVAEMFSDTPPEVTRKVTHDNARDLYRIEVDA